MESLEKVQDCFPVRQFSQHGLVNLSRRLSSILSLPNVTFKWIEPVHSISILDW